MKLLLFKAMVRGYTRKDGTTVKPYSTKAPSAKGRTSGQRDLFGGESRKLPPNRFKGVDPLAATPDLFDTVSEPRQDLIAEHKRLVAVLRSPSHKDDVAEAKRQEAELKEYEDDQHGHLLSGLPDGAKFKRGKGLIAGHYAVDVGGEVVGNFHKRPEDAVADAKSVLMIRDQQKKEDEQHSQKMEEARKRIMSGGEITDGDLKMLDIKAGSSDMAYFMSRAGKLFDINPRDVRQYVKDFIKIGHTENGVKKEFVPPKKAIRAIANGLGASSAVEKQEVKASEPVKKTETPAFKNWFGNSKVVDAEGKPLVVYHTTPNDFSEFKPGGDNDQKSGRAMWFGVDAHNPQAAHNVLQGRKAGKFKDGVRTMPVYLRMQRPLVIDDSTREWVRSVWGSDFPQIISPEMVADLKQDYDGVIFHSPLNGKISEYIVFEPNQIKSAIANNGDYSSHPDMTKAVLFRKVAQ